jgi:AcrR family transcriptional regulator
MASPFLEFYAENPTVAEENTFRQARPNAAPPPSFSAVRPRLPQPFWDGHATAIRCYWKAWELAFGNLQQVTPANGFIEPFIDSAFNSCLFLWDSVVTLLFARYGRGAFDFQRTLDNLYAKQHRDGFISREIHESDGGDQFHRYDPVSTGPNVLAWCEWENWLNFGDRERLGRVYPVLLAYHEWLRRFRTWPDGSYMSCGLACGMDNQPRVLPGQHAFMDHAWSAWIDATAQAALSARLLAAMADTLGRGSEPPAAACRAEAALLASYVNDYMWDESRGVYADRRLRGASASAAGGGGGSALSSSGSIASFWPLLAGIVPASRVPRLVAHLDDPAAFNRAVRPPALSARDPSYQPRGGYWNVRFFCVATSIGGRGVPVLLTEETVEGEQWV